METRGTQAKLVKATGKSSGYISEIINRKKRPSWDLAKKLAEATGTSPVLWMEGTTADIKAAIAELDENTQAASGGQGAQPEAA